VFNFCRLALLRQPVYAIRMDIVPLILWLRSHIAIAMLGILVTHAPSRVTNPLDMMAIQFNWDY
jgi:hypothetical protein